MLQRAILTLCLTLAASVSSGQAALEESEMRSFLEIREQKLEETPSLQYLKDRWVLTKRTQNHPKIARAQPLNTQYPWKKDIMTTVFWIGEKPTKNNPVPNDKSSWDSKWAKNYGGYDCPNNRIGYKPVGFIPRQNPFYVALPYNDISTQGTKPEAKKVIPWFKETFQGNGKTVIKGRWIAIHYKGKVCYAQWEDCGPYRTDHWQYVFGSERPSPNRNQGAGLDISPAVRDYLGMKGNDKTDWKFVEISEIPSGPWTKYGENNPFSPQSQNKMLVTSNQKHAETSP